MMTFHEALIQAHLLRPYALLALLPLPLILLLLRRYNHRDSAWRRFCDPHLLPHLLQSASQSKRPSLISFALAWLLATLALAGPTVKQYKTPVYEDRQASILILDLSRTMQVADLKPSRLARTRYKLLDFLNEQHQHSGQTALVVFANDAFTVTPLTTDTHTISSLVPSLSVDLMPEQGQRPATGIALALELLRNAGETQGHLILITSTDHVSAAMRGLLPQLKRQHATLSVLAIGSAVGGPIPTRNGFLKQANGSLAISAPNIEALSHYAAEAGGHLSRLTADNRDWQRVAAINHSQLKKSHTQYTRWEELGPWLLIILLPLAIAIYRRGILGLLLLCVLPLPSPQAQALTFSDLWLRADQQAARALAQGENKKALQLFHDPHWQAIAAYRAGDYKKAAKALAPFTDATSLYNRGNALAKARDYKAALAAFDNALKQTPDDADLKFNRDLVARLLQQQRKSREKQNGNKHDKRNKDASSQKKSPSTPQKDNTHTPEKNKSSAQNKENTAQEKNNAPQKKNNTAQEKNNAPQKKNNTAQEKNNARQKKDNPTREKNNAPQKKNNAAREKKQHQQRQEQISAQQPPKSQPNDNLSPAEKRQQQQQLRRIPDDPGGLLRRKFMLKHRQRQLQRW